MTDARQTPSAEEQMLAHVREHSAMEPPAHLDALILAAARREAPAPVPGGGSAGCRPASVRVTRWPLPACSAWP